MYIEGMSLRRKTANLTMKVTQSAQSLQDFLHPIAIPISSGYSSDATSESQSGQAVNTRETAIGQAIQASQSVLENWSKHRFMVLSPRFSPQMKEYWTPKRQESFCRSLPRISQPLSRLEILERRPASPDSQYVVVHYIATSADSEACVRVQLVIGLFGEIAAFYVSLSPQRRRSMSGINKN